MPIRPITLIRACLAWLAVTVAAQTAQAQSLAAARAEEWFRVGKERLAREDYEGACSALTESVELERASGALLALALCHERQRRFASAFREYTEVANRSQLEQRSDRQAAARKKANSLEWKLSSLRISSNAETPELSVRLNGIALDNAQLGAPIPVDGGNMLIEASAPNKRPWSTQLVVGTSSDRQNVSIPELEPLQPVRLAVAAPLPAAKPSRTSSTPPETAAESYSSSGMSGTQWVGMGAMGVGILGALAGGVLVLHAVGKNNDSKQECIVDLCTLEGRRDRLYARDAGNAATITFISAGAVAAAGIVLYIAGGQGRAAEARARSALSGSMWAAPGAAGASLRGQF